MLSHKSIIRCPSFECSQVYVLVSSFLDGVETFHNAVRSRSEKQEKTTQINPMSSCGSFAMKEMDLESLNPSYSMLGPRRDHCNARILFLAVASCYVISPTLPV